MRCPQSVSYGGMKHAQLYLDCMAIGQSWNFQLSKAGTKFHEQYEAELSFWLQKQLASNHTWNFAPAFESYIAINELEGANYKVIRGLIHMKTATIMKYLGSIETD